MQLSFDSGKQRACSLLRVSVSGLNYKSGRFKTLFIDFKEDMQYRNASVSKQTHLDNKMCYKR